MKSKYEKLIECIINEDHEKATELFHKIVIEKSREIYESFNFEEMGGDKIDNLMHEVSVDEEGMCEDEDEFGDEEGDFGDTGTMGGDEGDMADFGADDDMGGDEFEMGDDDIEDRVVDLEDALDELRAEFDRLMSAEENSGHDDIGGDSGMSDMDDEGEDHNFGGEEDDEMGESVNCSGSGMMESDSGSGEELDEDFEFMREYVEKVSLPANKNEGGEVGSKGQKVSVNTKGTVAGKNDMGGTTANIAKGGANQAPDGTTPKTNAKKPGDLPNAGKFANVPGGDAGKTWYKKAQDTGDKSETGKEVGAGGKKVNVNKKAEITGNNTGNKPGKK
jgi:hypothetical protein